MYRRHLILSSARAAGAALAGPALADWKPERPINIIVPWAAGGSTDQVIRVVAGELQNALGQTVVVVNQPGGSGSIGWAGSENAEVRASGSTVERRPSTGADRCSPFAEPYVYRSDDTTSAGRGRDARMAGAAARTSAGEGLRSAGGAISSTASTPAKLVSAAAELRPRSTNRSRGIIPFTVTPCGHDRQRLHSMTDSLPSDESCDFTTHQAPAMRQEAGR